MRPSASSGPRDDVPSSAPSSLAAENDLIEDEAPSGSKPRSRATSMIRRTSPVTTRPFTMAPVPPPIPLVLEADRAPDPPSVQAPVAEPAPDPEPVAAEPAPDPEPAAAEPAPDPEPAAAEPAPDPEPAAAEASPPSPDPDPVTESAAEPSLPTQIPSPTPSAAHRSLLADPTQRPPDAASPSERGPALSTTKPMLASEALMEDLAPMEPARRDARIWCAACGVAFLFFGVLPLVGLVPGALAAAIPWFVTGAISLVAGGARATYRQRAMAMLVLGALTGLVALQGSGTLVRADGGPGWGVARLCSVVALTAALLFRARYRAYAGARVFLGTALVISLPFVVHESLVLTSVAGFGPAHVGAILVLLTVVATLLGFMGAETLGAGPYVAAALVIVFAVELALRGVAVVGISVGIPPLLGVLVGAAGFGAAAGFTALGLFQILAWRFAADARRIDLHSGHRDTPAPSEHDPSSEWSTRE